MPQRLDFMAIMKLNKKEFIPYPATDPAPQKAAL